MQHVLQEVLLFLFGLEPVSFEKVIFYYMAARYVISKIFEILDCNSFSKKMQHFFSTKSPRGRQAPGGPRKKDTNATSGHLAYLV